MTTLDKTGIEAARNEFVHSTTKEQIERWAYKWADDLLSTADALSSLPAQAVKRFPVLNSDGATIDWRLVADHGAQAQKNHYQSVPRLAERGGLAWSELYAVLHDKPFQMMDTNDAITACRALEARYLAALAPSLPAAVAVTDDMVERACEAFKQSIWNNSGAPVRSRDMRKALEAALRSTP